MVDNPNYKNHLTPEQYEVCWNKGTEPRFQESIMTARTRASIRVSAAAIVYLPQTPSLILALGGPASGLQ
jgi:hypothetical protein